MLNEIKKYASLSTLQTFKNNLDNTFATQSRVDDLSTNVAYIDPTDNENIEDASGGASANAVLYTPQTLTEAQKAQARENIGVSEGKDGVSPTVSVSKSGKVTTVTITDKNGTKTATINDGADGKDGVAGSNGKDGKTPIKGVDYYTEADKAEIVAAVIESLGGNPIFGIVDENNNIIVNGDLPDGTYTVKYEMEGGKIINIGNLVLDSNVYYTVTKNLTNCTISNSATQIVQGGSYSATITAKSGYELKSVSVTMGGSAVSVSGGVINIASVTGNIVITAVAEEAGPSYTNLATKLANGYRYSQSNGNGQTLIQATGCCACEDFIPFVPNTTVRVKGLGDLTAQNTMYYKSDKTLYTNGKPHAMPEYTSYNYDSANDIVTLIPRAANVGYVRFTGVLSGTTEDVVITVNEEIV